MNRHEVDAISLAFGTLFLAVVGWWLLVRSIDIDPPSIGWFVAGGLIVAGVLGLVAAVLPRRRQPTSG
jgi:hypothetical protein